MTNLFGVIGGSHAYGLENSQSDFDTYYIHIPTAKEYWNGLEFDDHLEIGVKEEHKVFSLHKFIKMIEKQNSLIAFEACFSQATIYLPNFNDELFVKHFRFNRQLFGFRFAEHLVKSAHTMFLKDLRHSPKTTCEVMKRFYLAENLLTNQEITSNILNDKQIENLKQIRYNENYFVMHERSIRSKIEEYFVFLDGKIMECLLERTEDNNDDLIVYEQIEHIMNELYEELK